MNGIRVALNAGMKQIYQLYINIYRYKKNPTVLCQYARPCLCFFFTETALTLYERLGHGITVNVPIPDAQIWANVQHGTNPLGDSCGKLTLRKYMI